VKFRVNVLDHARKQYEALDPSQVASLNALVDELAADPWIGGLYGSPPGYPETWRIAFFDGGRGCIVYAIVEEWRLIHVLRVETL
jgi:mRNA-degrading endonuclease RelE of RelBE toxin-antitoxin system